MKITPQIQAKINVVEEWVRKYGKIWSRKVLYELVSTQLVKDTSRGQYSQVCKLFMKLRKDEIIPYEWFKDKKTEVNYNCGISDSDMMSFDERFQRLAKYYNRSSRSLQKCYIELWTEKEFPDTIKSMLDDYEVGIVTSQGFVGDVAQHDALERIRKIQDKLNISIIIFYVSDYDCEGEHIYGLIKQEFEKFGIRVIKLAVKKEHIKKLRLISNIGYRERMLKPKTLKSHLTKAYVKEFFEKNKDLAPDGIVQYELDAYPVEILQNLIENAISKFIDVKIIEDTDKICKKEAKRWVKKYYKGDNKKLFGS